MLNFSHNSLKQEIFFVGVLLLQSSGKSIEILDQKNINLIYCVLTWPAVESVILELDETS